MPALEVLSQRQSVEMHQNIPITFSFEIPSTRLHTTSSMIHTARQMCRAQQIPARSSSSSSSSRTCLPCLAATPGRKARRHHFDCSSQPQHCRSTVCQAHTLLVSKISHSGQGGTAEQRTTTHPAPEASFTFPVNWTPQGHYSST